jgi:hypothetical protein
MLKFLGETSLQPNESIATIVVDVSHICAKTLNSPHLAAKDR